MNIFEVIYNNDINKVKEFLDSGLDVNFQDNDLETPLYIACEYTNIEIAKFLLTHPDIKIDFDITEFKNQVEIYPYLKRKQNINLDKVNKILDIIED